MCWLSLVQSCAMQVTPSSKVVGDLAQFMVQNELTEETLVERADTLALPNRCASQLGMGFLCKAVLFYKDPLCLC